MGERRDWDSDPSVSNPTLNWRAHPSNERLDWRPQLAWIENLRFGSNEPHPNRPCSTIFPPTGIAISTKQTLSIEILGIGPRQLSETEGLNLPQLTGRFKWTFDWRVSIRFNWRVRSNERLIDWRVPLKMKGLGSTASINRSIDVLNQLSIEGSESTFTWPSQSSSNWRSQLTSIEDLNQLSQMTCSIDFNWRSQLMFWINFQLTPLNHLQLTVSINLNWGSWKINFFKKINFSIDPLNHLQLKGFSINFHFWAHTPPVYRAAVKTHQRK